MITPSKPRLRSATVEAFLRGSIAASPDLKLATARAEQAAREGRLSSVTSELYRIQRPARAKRQAYDIRFRCTLNGCDWTARLFLREASEAFDVMYSRLAYGEGTGQGKLRYGREFYRVVSCDLSPDQSRPGG